MPNQLQYEKSPYLLQHAENPVAWRPWGEAAFEDARREDKPVFLSIGYSTCHWCHVMAHESFEAEDAAALLNEAFIPVKVDREERPDVDAVYMAACIAMNGSGGWPLTVLLTPDQKPFWVGTYLPKGQLLSVLEQVRLLWKEKRGKLLNAGNVLTEYLRQADLQPSGSPSRELVEAGLSLFAQSFDKSWGGFGSAPKFPTPHNLLFLLRYADAAGDRKAFSMAEETLKHMYLGGLFDHIGGGFSRYSTDRQWLVPHFEKMLYDNALLSLAYTEAFCQTKKDWLREAAARTLDYTLAELSIPEGAFCCGQDADSDGVEGKYYVFTPEELSAVLGADSADGFCQYFDITPQGNFEGKSIPNRIRSCEQEPEAVPDELQRLLPRIYEYRLGRTRLHRDDKILTSWNGLMLAALSRAGLIFEEPRYLTAAGRIISFIRTYLKDENGRLLARWRDGEAAHSGKLEDYAFYIWGLLEFYGAAFRTDALDEACGLAGQLLDFFFDHEAGGFYPYSKDGEQLITRTKEAYDGAVPSGNSVSALVLSRLAHLTGEERFRRALDLQLSYLAGAVSGYPAGHSFTLLVLLEELWPTAELVVCTAEKLQPELFDFLRKAPVNGLTVLIKTPENQERLAALAPFTSGYPIPPSGAQYYLCRGKACMNPAGTIRDLERALKQGS